MDPPSSSDVTTLKLLLMGDSGTGKSSILLRFCDDQFIGEEAATIGVDLRIKMLENFQINKNSQQQQEQQQGTKIKLTIWDTAGQERFRSLTSSYYRGAQGVVLVYDVTSRDSFNDLKAIWLKELSVYADLDELVLMIVGNKIDLESERQVSTEEGLQLAQELSALFMESSAKTRVGIKAIFEELVRKIMNSTAASVKKKTEKEQKLAVSLQADEDDEEAANTCSC